MLFIRLLLVYSGIFLVNNYLSSKSMLPISHLFGEKLIWFLKLIAITIFNLKQLFLCIFFFNGQIIHK